MTRSVPRPGDRFARRRVRDRQSFSPNDLARIRLRLIRILQRAVNRRPHIGFFCRTTNREILKHVEFYAQDLRILDDLGCSVHISTSPAELRSADLYFGWWWTWGFAPVLAGQLLRRPTVITGVFNAWAYPNRAMPLRALHRVALRGASANVFISRFEHERVTRDFDVTRPEYCPLAVDTTLYKPGTRQRRPFLLCIAGSGMHNSNSFRKCIPELIRAFAILHSRRSGVRLCLVGRKGSDYPALASLARDLGVFDAIDFVGVVSVEEKIRLLQECLLYVQPSRFEGFGLSVLEAMSCGASVVTSDVGAIPEVVGDTAAFADGTDPAALARVIEELLDADSQRSAMGLNARERAERSFPYARRRDYFAGLLDELLTAPRQ